MPERPVLRCCTPSAHPIQFPSGRWYVHGRDCPRPYKRGQKVLAEDVDWIGCPVHPSEYRWTCRACESFEEAERKHA